MNNYIIYYLFVKAKGLIYIAVQKRLGHWEKLKYFHNLLLPFAFSNL